ncbi:unnamed protein product [Scytosiphon promiscuus]
MERIMHPREGAAAPMSPSPLSVEVWKQRAQKRGSLIKAMATSQHLSAASAADSGLVVGRVGGRATPPEMERPPPYVKDVLAMQGAAERGIKKFEVSNLSAQPHQKPQANLGPVVQAAANFAAEDSADEDSDDAGSLMSSNSFQRR